MNVRDLTVKFTSYAHYFDSREWAREDARLPRLLCVAPDLSQAHAACSSSQAHPSSWIDVMDNIGCAVERAWSTFPHLVAGHATAQPSSTTRWFAQTKPV